MGNSTPSLNVALTMCSTAKGDVLDFWFCHWQSTDSSLLVSTDAPTVFYPALL